MVPDAPAFANAFELSWLWLLPALPLAGAAINGLAGARLQRRAGKGVVSAIAIAAVVLAAALAEVAFWVKLRPLLPESRFLEDHLWTMWRSGLLRVELTLLLDPLSMVFALVITHVGALIHVYAAAYLEDDPALWRFFAWLNLFVAAMLLLVLGSNFVALFIGWEGVGLCSWGLIGFWHHELQNAQAALKAFVVNRIGDLGFLLGVLLLFWALAGVWTPARYVAARTGLVRAPAQAGPAGPAGPAVLRVGATIELRELRNQVALEWTGMARHLQQQRVLGVPLLFLVCALLFLGACGKSAQVPLHVWLPDAMAGPTPVSALIHAATMVTAGVYLLARLHFLFVLSPGALTLVACTGALTALFGASVALVQVDLKRVLAWSTVSQLGFMFLGVGAGAAQAGVFHVVTHAFFKACLFLAAGSAILACHHEQDLRRMGGLRRFTPFTRWTYLVATCAIAGFPIAAGFYSKDELLARAFSSENLLAPWLGPALWSAGVLAALGTSFYMFRSYYLAFSGEYRGDGGHAEKERIEDPHALPTHARADALLGHPHPVPAPAHAGSAALPRESPRRMTGVLVALAAASVLAALLGLPAAWTGAMPLLEGFLAPSLPLARLARFAELSLPAELGLQALGVAVALAGFGAARALYLDGRSPLPARARAAFPRLWALLFDQFRVDALYGATVLRGTLALSRACAWVDGRLLDGAVHLVARLGRTVAEADALFDAAVVDGAVTAVAGLALRSGRTLRRLQTGRVQTYLYGALAGALVLVLLRYAIQ